MTSTDKRLQRYSRAVELVDCGQAPDLTQRAVALLREGVLPLQIAAQLGVAKSTLYNALNDPIGEDARTRKDRYAAICVRCGARTNGSDGFNRQAQHCGSCWGIVQHERRHWTKERIVAAMHKWADLHGEPPTSVDWNATLAKQPRGWEYPTSNTVQREFGSWNAAITAAGFVARKSGAGPGSLTSEAMEETIRLYQAGVSQSEIGRRFGITPAGVAMRLKAAGVFKPKRKGAAMPRAKQGGLTAIENEIQWTVERLKQLVLEKAEREEQLEKLQAARDVLSPNGAATEK